MHKIHHARFSVFKSSTIYHMIVNGLEKNVGLILKSFQNCINSLRETVNLSSKLWLIKKSKEWINNFVIHHRSNRMFLHLKTVFPFRLVEKKRVIDSFILDLNHYKTNNAWHRVMFNCASIWRKNGWQFRISAFKTAKLWQIDRLALIELKCSIRFFTILKHQTTAKKKWRENKVNIWNRQTLIFGGKSR